MSSPSKRRKAARAWMGEVAKKFAAEGHREGHRVGAREMRNDMMRLLPKLDRQEIDPVSGKPHVRSVIKAFPDPYEHGPYFRVPMPSGGYNSWPMHDHTRSSSMRMQHIDFRPIEHAIRTEGMGGVAELRWYTWEPTEGSAEIGEHTSALFTGMGKLGYVARLIEQSAIGAMYSLHANPSLAADLKRAHELLEECTEEFRRKLGKFAPIPSEEDERAQQRRYGMRW